MATRAKLTSTTGFAQPLADNLSYSGTFTGSFIGDLQGNATTATTLANAFVVTFTGDGSGHFQTNGNSTQCALTINKAATADRAAYAESAGNVQYAETAKLSTFAQESSTATNAAYATASDTATYAESAGTANKANTSARSEYAAVAEYANKAKVAEEVYKATEADHALTADSLTDPSTPVLTAKHAEKADIAQIAWFDCLGNPIHHYYATKGELEPYKGMVTIAEGEHLYLTREEKITQAVVRGKAIGSGVVTGNTLEIQIQKLAGGCGGFSVYDDILYRPELPPVQDRDTTSIYVENTTGKMSVWDNDNQTWINITSDLTQEAKDLLNDLSTKVEEGLKEIQGLYGDVVTINGAQTIIGHKNFQTPICLPIADLNDNTTQGRWGATIHNIRDVQSKVNAQLSEAYAIFMKYITTINERLDKQQFGDFLYADKDYTQEVNQGYMEYNTTYVMWLDEDKVYIQLDPDTWQPVDPSREVVWYRFITKSRSGFVTWYDLRVQTDPKAFVPWTNTEDGKRNIVLDQGSLLKSYDSFGNTKALIGLSQNNTVQTGTQETGYNIRALNGKVTINGQDVIAVAKDFDNYMPKSGGDFTGSITVPDLNINTYDGQVLNSKTTADLIDSKLRAYDNNLNLQKYMPKAGGDFTGVVTVPDSIDLTQAEDDVLINLGDIKKLLDSTVGTSGFLKLVLLGTAPQCELDEDVLYSIPLDTFDGDSDISSIRVEPDDQNADPLTGEGVIYKSKDLL